MNNYIILSSCLFGSVYLTSKSLELINRSFVDDKKMPRELIILNGIALMASSSVFVGGFALLSLAHFKYMRE